MQDCNPVVTPCQAGVVFTKQDCPKTPDAQRCTEYRELVALANFISCWTRPDITFTVNKLCKYMSNPGLSLASPQASTSLPQRYATRWSVLQLRAHSAVQGTSWFHRLFLR